VPFRKCDGCHCSSCAARCLVRRLSSEQATKGQAVAFIADAGTPTVTDWTTNGVAAADPCIDKELLATPETVVVTFYQPGDYLIGCRKVAAMNTVVHVQ